MAFVGGPAWAVVAAFGVYFCMYGVRRPYTAARFDEHTVFGTDEKTALLITQVVGYALAKVLAVPVVSGMHPSRRAGAVLGLVLAGQAPLVLFGLLPPPWRTGCLFLNGLALGMVFGLVVSFLEGRRQTELLAAGLCTSFVLADGVVKDVGTQLLAAGVPDGWMPAAAGGIFLVPFLGFVWMLTRVRAPDALDVLARTARPPLTRADRAAFLRKHAVTLAGLVGMFLAATVARAVRGDFLPELRAAVGASADRTAFTRTEAVVALAVLAATGLTVAIRSNRRAFFAAVGVSLLGVCVVPLALAGRSAGYLGGDAFVLLLGVGIAVPYVMAHTTLFERLIALTRDRGSVAFLLSAADAVGYFGVVAVLLAKPWLAASGDAAGLVLTVSAGAAAVAGVGLIVAALGAGRRAVAAGRTDG